MLVESLCIPLINDHPSQLPAGHFVLVVQSRGLALHYTGSRAPGPIFVDFTAGKNAYRLQCGGGKSQLIAKAVGLRSSFRPHVLDVTAGLGQDGFVLATLGCKLTLLERVPVIYHLLRDGIERALGSEKVDGIAQRMSLIQQGSHEYLRALEDAVDVIYLDPMFPEREKTAKVNKAMTAFHALVGADKDAGLLLSLALNKARYRVVVKRSRKAPSFDQQFPFLDLPSPGLVLAGKSSRYDVYPIKKMP